MTQAVSLRATHHLDRLVSGLLDKGYDRATFVSLRAISASVTSGVVEQRLAELDAEVAKVAERGKRLAPDNPALQRLLDDLNTALKADRRWLNAGATNAQAVGVNAAGQLVRPLTFPGIPASQLAAAVRWNVPDPEAVNALVGYVTSLGWAAEIARYPALVLATVQHQAVLGMIEGWGAQKTAREIRRMAQNVPIAQANNLMRTAQLQSFRDATAIHHAANADVLTGQIRLSALDDRTCLACIALHGTRLPVGERLLDHHRGRCVAIAEVRGRPRVVQTGEQWFASLPEERQRGMAGDAAFEALQSGKATLQEFVQPYQDRVFGEMIREASVKGVLSKGV